MKSQHQVNTTTESAVHSPLSSAEISRSEERSIMEIRTSLYAFILFALSAFALGGCGGGGGGSSTPPQTAIPLTTSDIRTYKQGDMLTATLTIRDTASGETASGDITITVGGIVQNPFGIDCRSVDYSGTLTGPAGTEPFSLRALFYQDNNNSLYECGEFDDTLDVYVFLTDTATSPNGVFLETKSPVQLGDITSGVVFFDDGTWQDCTRTVQTKENVSVPLGLYESYKIAESCSYSDGGTGGTLVNTIWNVPDIFNLKEAGILDGWLSLEYEVKSTNF